jgi:hypothetical protein
MALSKLRVPLAGRDNKQLYLSATDGLAPGYVFAGPAHAVSFQSRGVVAPSIIQRTYNEVTVPSILRELGGSVHVERARMMPLLPREPATYTYTLEVESTVHNGETLLVLRTQGSSLRVQKPIPRPEDMGLEISFCRASVDEAAEDTADAEQDGWAVGTAQPVTPAEGKAAKGGRSFAQDDVCYFIRVLPAHGQRVQVDRNWITAGSFNIFRGDAMPMHEVVINPYVANEMRRAHFPVLVGLVQHTRARFMCDLRDAITIYRAPGNAERPSRSAAMTLADDKEFVGAPDFMLGAWSGVLTRDPKAPSYAARESTSEMPPGCGGTTMELLANVAASDRVMKGPGRGSRYTIYTVYKALSTSMWRLFCTELVRGASKTYRLPTGAVVLVRPNWQASTASHYDQRGPHGVTEAFHSIVGVAVTVLSPPGQAAADPKFIAPHYEELGPERRDTTALLRMRVGIQAPYYGFAPCEGFDKPFIRAGVDSIASAFNFVDVVKVLGECALGPCVAGRSVCVHTVEHDILEAAHRAMQERVRAWHIRACAREYTDFGIALASSKAVPEPAVAVASVRETRQARVPMAYTDKMRALEIALRESVQTGADMSGAECLVEMRRKYITTMVPPDASPGADNTAPEVLVRGVQAFLQYSLRDRSPVEKAMPYAERPGWEEMGRDAHDLVRMELERLERDEAAL